MSATFLHRAGLLAATVLVLLAGSAFADEPTHDEMMKIYLKAAAPGPEHAWIAKHAGKWNCTMRSWMDPAGEPMVSQGVEESKMILDGRFLSTEFNGENMGMPFTGRGLMGYDNVKKKYVGTWLDNMGTGIMSYEGDYDSAKKELVCKGEFADAATGQAMACTMVTRFLSDDRHVFEMWGPSPAGDNVKWMEIEYNRAR
ncbi:MAG TPA: DUF1579 domain-containing protein [Candidatus Krumholzibacteria bacterium]|nr:DUF1579 domain-containing protein [Candidatus Krumholzibacteria bacterium]HPD70375.1 DUF1579 domain-containing protein [Candidatus Krumholzibacteria bacterium]HRY39925.1 DUF1579 domain-containing protein [Candidatus Krumholzibacteria bacterium]